MVAVDVATRLQKLLHRSSFISRRAPEDLLKEVQASLKAGALGGGFSPHSPYATMPGLLELAAVYGEAPASQ